jgi:hypothetical protein
MVHYRKQLLSIAISSQQHESQQGSVAFPFSKLSIPVLGPTQIPIHWVPGCYSGG